MVNFPNDYKNAILCCCDYVARIACKLYEKCKMQSATYFFNSLFSSDNISAFIALSSAKNPTYLCRKYVACKG